MIRICSYTKQTRGHAMLAIHHGTACHCTAIPPEPILLERAYCDDTPRCGYILAIGRTLPGRCVGSSLAYSVHVCGHVFLNTNFIPHLEIDARAFINECPHLTQMHASTNTCICIYVQMPASIPASINRFICINIQMPAPINRRIRIYKYPQL